MCGVYVCVCVHVCVCMCVCVCVRVRVRRCACVQVLNVYCPECPPGGYNWTAKKVFAIRSRKGPTVVAFNGTGL